MTPSLGWLAGWSIGRLLLPTCARLCRAGLVRGRAKCYTTTSDIDGVAERDKRQRRALRKNHFSSDLYLLLGWVINENDKIQSWVKLSSCRATFSSWTPIKSIWQPKLDRFFTFTGRKYCQQSTRATCRAHQTLNFTFFSISILIWPVRLTSNLLKEKMNL